MAETKTPRPRAVRHDGWTPVRRERFLEALAVTGCVTAAAKEAGKGKCTAYTLKHRDPAFSEAWDIAIQGKMDDLEATLRDRVINGVECKLHYQGKVFAEQRVYSDRLAMFMLSRHRPAAYSELAALREEERPARDICETLKDAALRVIEARLTAGRE